MAKPKSSSKVPDAKTLAEQLQQQLQTDATMKTWFEKYNKHTWDDFIKQYSHTKSLALQHPKLFINDFKPANKEFNQLARQALEAIQQKKLFNLQCQWRAESVQLPFVQISYDFEIIGRNQIMECPFLPPVSWDEVELFIQYLESSDSDDLNLCDMYHWQEYEDMKEEDETGEFSITPSWYEFYDSRRGTGYLLRLPNVRGIKEDAYMEKARELKRASAPPYVPNPEMDKPYPSYEAKMDFARCFETQEIAEIIISHIKTYKHNSNHEVLDEDYEYLKTIPETIPFVPHNDWRESLRLTVQSYRNFKTAEALPRVWRHYSKKFGNDPDAYVRKRIASADFDLSAMDDVGIRKMLLDFVLKGRELMGEPMDFDY